MLLLPEDEFADLAKASFLPALLGTPLAVLFDPALERALPEDAPLLKEFCMPEELLYLPAMPFVLAPPFFERIFWFWPPRDEVLLKDFCIFLKSE